tara:strand:- start:896 stop:1699 length:804 start_codon:yes stop_codon:yes gene_type:complete
MPTVVGIRFRRAGRLYYFDPIGIDLHVNDLAVVDSANHHELGRVVLAPTDLADAELKSTLKKVIRKGTKEDKQQMDYYRDLSKNTLTRFKDYVQDTGLPISPLKADYCFDGSNLSLQFSAEKDIDYKALASDLAKIFETRIELRQVGPRDRASIVDGVGQCGLSLCCSTWLIEPGNVTVKMAKSQNLPLNPAKISGVCGRLLCCLRYEHDMYLEGPLNTKAGSVADDNQIQDTFMQATSGREQFGGLLSQNTTPPTSPTDTDEIQEI